MSRWLERGRAGLSQTVLIAYVNSNPSQSLRSVRQGGQNAHSDKIVFGSIKSSGQIKRVELDG